MNKRLFVIELGIVAVVICILIGILAVLLRQQAYVSNQIPIMDTNNKAYNVKEISELLKTNPASLQGRQIQIEAYIVNSVRGVACSDYQILAGTPADEAPILFTGQTLTLPKEFYPSYHAIYQGHFYDAWATTTCGSGGFKRFVIDKKIQELAP